MKKAGDQERTRGIKEVKEQLAKDSEADVRESTIKAGEQLLNEFVGSMNITLRPEELKHYLELLIIDTEFADAIIIYRGEAHHGYQRDFPPHDYRLHVIFGHYPHDAYNIWFQRDNGKWILNYNKVPKGGNWR